MTSILSRAERVTDAARAYLSHRRAMETARTEGFTYVASILEYVRQRLETSAWPGPSRWTMVVWPAAQDRRFWERQFLDLTRPSVPSEYFAANSLEANMWIRLQDARDDTGDSDRLQVLCSLGNIATTKDAIREMGPATFARRIRALVAAHEDRPVSVVDQNVRPSSELLRFSVPFEFASVQEDAFLMESAVRDAVKMMEALFAPS
ncbi:MAG: hypothetical protein R3F39_14105 [Myxococcota bacterium]